MKKRGISAVVASVLIVLLCVVGVGIVWLGIMPMIADINIDKSAGLRLVSTEGHTLWDPESRLSTVQIERAGNSPDVYGIDIVFSFDGNTVTHFVEDVPGLNGKRVYHVNLSEYPGDLDSIKIIPIFWGGIAGGVASELKIERIPEVDIVEMIEDKVIAAEEFVEPTGYSGGGSGSSSNNGGSSSGGNDAETSTCNNNIVESGETCDGVNLNLQNCSSQGFSLGNLSCLNDCSGYDVGECVSCNPATDPIDPCGSAVCGIAQNGSCGSVNCGSCTGEDVCSDGACVAGGSGLTPIARFDVVPYQRINAGEIFNLGVVAFSKEGIDRVEFNVSGQGYTGVNPAVSNEMTYNSRTDAWEYWIGIEADDFASDGPVVVEVTVVGKDGGVRDKDTDLEDGFGSLSMVVNPSGSLPEIEVWVSVSGDDSLGVVNDSARPFLTIGRAVEAVQNEMINLDYGGKVDGGVVRLYPGNYVIEDGGVSALSTVDEWLTITNYPEVGGNKDNTIINGNANYWDYSIPVDFLKIEGLTLMSTGEWEYVITENQGYGGVWVDDSNLLGPDRYASSGNEGRVRPVAGYAENGWITNSYISEVDIASTADFNRNLTIETISSDVFRGALIINADVSDVDSGSFGYHADLWQFFGAPKKNYIMYGVRVTDAHYQGIFMRHDTSIASAQEDIAFVNNVFELRPVIMTDGVATNCDNENLCFRSVMNNQWNHLIMWHNTFIGHGYSGGVDRDGTEQFYNSSVIGNVFVGFMGTNNADGRVELDWTLPGNSNGNEFIHNHYYNSTVDSPQCWGWTDGQQRCSAVHPRSTSPDTEPNGVVTQSLGSGVLNEDYFSGVMGMPLEGSVLIDRINRSEFETVPVDALGNLRGSFADVGAYEYV